MCNSKPLIIQRDRSILLDVHDPAAGEARAALIPFAELEKSPEHIHTYHITHLSLWNAAGTGLCAEDVVEILNRFSKFPVPDAVLSWMKETLERFGKIRLVPAEDKSQLRLLTGNTFIFQELKSLKSLSKYLSPDVQKENAFLLNIIHRGTVKQILLKQGWPLKDEVPLREGTPLEINMKQVTNCGSPLNIRDYQKDAAQAFVGNKQAGTGFGTIVLPCGAGKTIVGLFIMSLLKTNTLILTTNTASVYQWKRELLDKTSLTEEEIGLYTGGTKEIKPVTIATYQVLTWRADTASEFPHFKIFRQRDWGLIIYDEVHLLPAPVFRITAELQVIRRLGLTATLVREDGCEGDVFSLVGPKRYDAPWKDLEEKGWIAKAYCIEIRVDLAADKEIEYAVAANREKHRIASENNEKKKIIDFILEKHRGESILIIGQYLKQLEELSIQLKAPLITGKKTNNEREILYETFRSGEIKVLIVSKVANFAIDLPDASVAVQISGAFGSRQEEAQRLGRILRPKKCDSHFYTIVTRRTVEEAFAEKRQKFLAEQGYDYSILNADETIKY